MKIVLKDSLRPRTPFTDKRTVKWVLKYVVALWLCFLAMQECQNEANGGKFRLRDLLSVPMQRVLKYPLLLRVCSSYMWSVFFSLVHTSVPTSAVVLQIYFLATIVVVR